MTNDMTWTLPLGAGVTAEVRVTGENVRPEHVDRLQQHLVLTEAALADAGDDDAPAPPQVDHA